MTATAEHTLTHFDNAEYIEASRCIVDMTRTDELIADAVTMALDKPRVREQLPELLLRLTMMSADISLLKRIQEAREDES
jgi:hypothetical protein